MENKDFYIAISGRHHEADSRVFDKMTRDFQTSLLPTGFKVTWSQFDFDVTPEAAVHPVDVDTPEDVAAGLEALAPQVDVGPKQFDPREATVTGVKTAVADIDNITGIEFIEFLERKNPEHKGGRTGALRHIEARKQQLIG